MWPEKIRRWQAGASAGQSGGRKREEKEKKGKEKKCWVGFYFFWWACFLTFDWARVFFRVFCPGFGVIFHLGLFLFSWRQPIFFFQAGAIQPKQIKINGPKPFSLPKSEIEIFTLAPKFWSSFIMPHKFWIFLIRP